MDELHITCFLTFFRCEQFADGYRFATPDQAPRLEVIRGMSTLDTMDDFCLKDMLCSEHDTAHFIKDLQLASFASDQQSPRS